MVESGSNMLQRWYQLRVTRLNNKMKKNIKILKNYWEKIISPLLKPKKKTFRFMRFGQSSEMSRLNFRPFHFLNFLNWLLSECKNINHCIIMETIIVSKKLACFTKEQSLHHYGNKKQVLFQIWLRSMNKVVCPWFVLVQK